MNSLTKILKFLRFLEMINRRNVELKIGIGIPNIIQQKIFCVLRRIERRKNRKTPKKRPWFRDPMSEQLELNSSVK